MRDHRLTRDARTELLDGFVFPQHGELLLVEGRKGHYVYCRIADDKYGKAMAGPYHQAQGYDPNIHDQTFYNLTVCHYQKRSQLALCDMEERSGIREYYWATPFNLLEYGILACAGQIIESEM